MPSVTIRIPLVWIVVGLFVIAEVPLVYLKRDPKGQRPSDDALKARSSVVNILNFYEEIAILVRTKGADEDRLQRFFRSLVCDGYAKLEDWIRHERTIDNRHGYSQ
jgi:hypothetical protein